MMIFNWMREFLELVLLSYCKTAQIYLFVVWRSSKSCRML